MGCRMQKTEIEDEEVHALAHADPIWRIRHEQIETSCRVDVEQPTHIMMFEFDPRSYSGGGDVIASPGDGLFAVVTGANLKRVTVLGCFDGDGA